MQQPDRRDILVAALACTGLVRAASAQHPTRIVDETWHDPARARDLPVRVRWPDATTASPPLPVVLFSHGLGGSVDAGTVWATAWARAGCVVIHMQHAGSDLPAVRAAATSASDLRALRQLASPAQLVARIRDVVFVLDEIGRRHSGARPGWADIRPTHIGMSGHSFGALTTMAMAGQRFPGVEPIDETRLSAFMPFSASLPTAGDAARAYAAIHRPLLTITGTRDDDVIGTGATPERRIAVFAALPPGDKAQLVLQDADHMTFSGQTELAFARWPRAQITRTLQAAHQATAAAISTDWWRAWLMNDAGARVRLLTPSGLRDGDLWQRK